MTEINWEPRDAQKLKEFLEDETGKKLKALFIQSAPFLKGDKFEEKALSAASYAQWLDDKEFIKRHSDPASFNNKVVGKSPYLDSSVCDVK